MALEYPIRIIPEEGWLTCVKCDAVLSVCSDAFIGRRIEGAKCESIDDSLGEDAMCLKVRALPSSEIPNLSTSLLGARHEVDDFHFCQKGKGSKDWDGKVVSIDQYQPDTDFIIIESEMIVAVWPAIELHKRPVPYKKVYTKKKEYNEEISNIKKSLPYQEIYFEEYEKLKKDEKGNPFCEFEGMVILNHCPTNLNYWHFTIDLYPAEASGSAIKNAKSAWRAMMCDNVADYMRRTFILLEEGIQPPKIYKWEIIVRNSKTKIS